jgi:nucleoside-diphosphate-sugar epimerase
VTDEHNTCEGGGAGFIGSHLCERLLSDGVKVICLDNFDSFYDPSIKIRNVEEVKKKSPELFEFVTEDIRNPEHLKGVFQRSCGTTYVDFIRPKFLAC